MYMAKSKEAEASGSRVSAKVIGALTLSHDTRHVTSRVR